MSVLEIDVLMEKPGFTLDLQCQLHQQITGVFGPSGAGKTTLIRILAGLEAPGKGRVSIGDREVFNSSKRINLPPEKRNVGFVFQEGRLFPHLTVIKNLRYGIKAKTPQSLFEEVTSMLKITDLLDKRISDISGGQAQRVAIGRALLSSPDLLMLDEPFSALDKNLRQHIISLLRPFIEKYKIPMLIISHELSDLLALTTQLLVIDGGKCTGMGNYYDLIMQEDTMSKLSKTGLMNVMELKLEHVDGEKGIMMLSNGPHQIYVESWLDEMNFFEDAMFNVMLRPEDITLALHHIKDISIQNQLEGKIEKLIIIDNKVLCMIDHGFKLIAEVTLATLQKMNLKEGDTIWSLFKAAAVKTNRKGIVNSKI